MKGTRLLSIEDRFGIQDLLFRFMRSFDEKDWVGMRACLSETVDCDYSSFRGTLPSKITRSEYAEQRKIALAQLKTQHDLSNIVLTRLGTQVEVRCNYVIRRFHPDFDGSREKFLHSYGQYRFMVSRLADVWNILSITQFLLMSEGNPELHGALRK